MAFVRICIHALTQSISPCPPRRPRPALRSGSSGTSPTGVFSQGDRIEANDEVRPTQLRLPSRSLPAPWPLLRMDLQSPRQDCQPEAQPASRPALSGRHETAPPTLKAALARMERLSRTALARLAKQADNADRTSIDDRRHRLFLRLQYHPDTYPTSSLSLALSAPDQSAVWM